MVRWRFRARLVVPAVLLFVSSAMAVEVVCSTDVEGVASDDTLQDVFATLSHDGQPSDRLMSGLVDGGSWGTVNLLGSGKPDNGVVLGGSPAAQVTWDLESDRSELRRLHVWLFAGQYRNFGGRISVSSDGAAFSPVEGTLVDREFAAGKDTTRLMHRVAYEFAPGEVKGFRFLRLEVLGHSGQPCDIREVDAWIENASPRKSTRIETTVKAVGSDLQRPPVDQTATPPMAVRAVRLDGEKLAVEGGKAILDFGALTAAPDDEWKMVEHKSGPRELIAAFRRSDGLQRTTRIAVDDRSAVSLEVTIALAADASKGVSYRETRLDFREADAAFDGIVYGSGCGPIFVPRTQAGLAAIGERPPYFIFPCEKEGLELQLFMPDWYGAIGTVTAFADGGPITWRLFPSAGAKPAADGRWDGREAVIEPGESLRYRINLGVFAPTPATLGQADIEESRFFSPLIGIYTGTGDQHVQGRPRVLQRDKMMFMGFDLPGAAKEKPGHQLQIEPTADVRPLLDRLASCGVGILTLLADYRDVSHGVSYQGDYEQAPPGFAELLDAIDARGMKAVAWFSPRGFLQKDWGPIPKDKIVEEHPEWFTEGSHWFGFYRTVDIFNPAPSEWAEGKFRQDLTRFGKLAGFSYDTFPAASLAVDPNTGLTGVASEMRWLRRFSETIRSFGPEKIVIANGGVPLAEDYHHYDYTASEHPLLMFVNDVTAGRVPFGHPFVPWEDYGQLYFWYSVLGQMYYNFCDYDQAAGWVGTTWIGLEPGQMRKDFDAHVAPIWRIIGKGRRVFGAQIAPGVRQIEAVMPDGSTVVIACNFSGKAADAVVTPATLPAGVKRMSVAVDTATEHAEFGPYAIEAGKPAVFEIGNLPPYSMAVFRAVGG